MLTVHEADGAWSHVAVLNTRRDATWRRVQRHHVPSNSPNEFITNRKSRKPGSAYHWESSEGAICRLTQVSGGVLLLEASDNGTVEIKLQLVGDVQLAHLQDDTPTTQFVEVIGRVSRTGDSITQHALLPLGDNLGM